MALSSPNRYLPGATSVPVRLQVSDSDGVHQVVLFVRGFANREVVACRGVKGRKDAVVEFEYNGAIPSNDAAGLSDAPTHRIVVEAVDTAGNARVESFGLAESSPYRIATVNGHSAVVFSVSFSSDRRTLASGAHDGTMALWDIAPYITPQFAAADFDRDGTVGFRDFLQFAAQFGTSQGDAGYDARFDLDGDGAVGFSDLLIFAERFGK